MGSFLFRWPYPARDVHVTGTFDDWGKTVQLNKVGDHWEKEVDLPSADEQILYKFVVDDEWVVDENAPKVDYGHWNMNNLLLPEQIKRKPAAATHQIEDSVPGAFPETPANENASFGVAPIPASGGVGNPVQEESKTYRTIHSTATTSKEDYEKPEPSPFPESSTKEPHEFSVNPIPAAGGVGNPTAPDTTSKAIDSAVTTSKEDYEKPEPSPFPESSTKEAHEFSVNPLPATAGIGNPVSVPAGSELPSEKEMASKTIGSSVTTSKEDYEKAEPSPFPESSTSGGATEYSINPLPATSGTGNPISIPAGSALPAHKDITSNTVESAVTTSKEDYEKGSSAAHDADSEVIEPMFSAQPVPASSGMGNPVSLPAGATVPDHKEVTKHTLDSNVTTSKEDYEKSGSSSFPSFSAAGAGALAAGAAGVAAVGAAGAAAVNAFSKDKTQKNIIPESGLPMGGEKVDVMGTGPFIQSSGPNTTTADLASKVPLESNPAISSSATGSTTADLASKVPLESHPTVSSSATGSTTADLASKVPLEPGSRPSVPDASTAKLASDLEVPLKGSPFIASGAHGTTTADLATKVPLENDPTIKSSATGATTSALAAGVPLETTGVPSVVKESISSAHQPSEAAGSAEAVREKANLEEELLSKTKLSQATGEPASAAANQYSYYGVATTIPSTVEKSMEKAHASPEAAAETSAVAEKSKMEEELLSKVPSTSEAGEPAPTIAAATSPTAPATTSTEAAATSLTDGKTANMPVPDTDTSSAAHGKSAGAIAGGAAVGGIAAAGVATLAARHKDADVEPPRIADSQKPDITTERSPATAVKDHTSGLSTSATPAVSDSVASLANEPAIKMMKQNENLGSSNGPSIYDATTSAAPKTSTAAAVPYIPTVSGTDATSGPKPDIASTVHDATTSVLPASTVAGSSVGPSKDINSTAVGSSTTTKPTTAAVVPTTVDPVKDGSTSAVGPSATTTSTTAAVVPTTVEPVKDVNTTAVGSSATTKPTTTAVVPTTAEPIKDVSTSAVGSSATTKSTAAAATATGATTSTGATKDATALTSAAGVPSSTSAGSEAPKVSDKVVASLAEPLGTTEPVAPSTPAKKPTTASAVNSPASATTSTATKDKKKRHRLSTFIKKIFD